jgi:AAA domain
MNTITEGLANLVNGDAEQAQRTYKMRAEVSTPTAEGNKLPKTESKANGIKKEKAWKKYQIKSIADLAGEEIDRELYLLGDGWLERGSGGFVVAGSGVGKSVLSFQMGTLWGCGREAFGISAYGPIKVAIFQAEDGDNDQRRMARMFNTLGLSEKEKELSRQNCLVIPCNDLSGEGFLKMVDGYLEDNPTDLLIINPLNSYLEGAAVDEEKAKDFLRINLNPILSSRNVGCLIMHHTPKQNYRDTTNWNHSAFMYAMAGHADLTNWARAVIVIEPSNDPSVFQFIAAKRGQLIGWDEIRRYWAHADKGKPWMAAKTPRNVITPNDIKDILKGRVDAMHKTEISKQARLRGFKNEDELSAALTEGEKGEMFFKDIIRDGGSQKRYGFVTSEPCYDIPSDLYALIPPHGVGKTEIEDSAKTAHGYYRDEVQEGIGMLISQGRVIERQGTGRDWAKKTLHRCGGAEVIIGFAPSGEVTRVTVTTVAGWVDKDI